MSTKPNWPFILFWTGYAVLAVLFFKAVQS